MDPLFPALPESLADLTGEELDALLADSLRIVDAIDDQDADVIGDRDQDAIVKELTSGVALIEALKAEKANREQAAAENAQKISELVSAAKAGQDAETEDEPVEPVAEDDKPADPDDAPADPAEDVEPVEPVADITPVEPDAPVELPVAASAESIAAAASRATIDALTKAGMIQRATPPPTGGQGRHAPKKARKGSTVIVAAADLPGVPSGNRLPGLPDVAQAMIRKHDSMRSARLDGTRVPIATVTASYGEDRTLVPGDDRGNEAKLEAVIGPQAIVASGGVCAPVTPWYELMDVTTAARPVRDALPSFNAVRGGIHFSTPETIADISEAVGVVTNAEEVLGGTNSAKTCQTIDCASFTQVDVSAIYHCLQFGNLPARVWPEKVAHFTSLTMAAHARLAEGTLLDLIATASTAVSDTANVTNIGMVADFFPSVIKAAAAYRSRHRMDPNATIRVLIPAWARDMAAADLMRSSFYMPEAALAFLDQKLALAGVRASYYIDTNTGGGQVFGAQTASILLDFPTNIVWYLFAEGSFVYLDGGTLELGLVRDSTLNSTNDYQVFGETWESVAFVGIESLKVTSVVADTGNFASNVAIVAAG